MADNGTYNLVLSVTDKDGAITNQTTSVKVDSVALSIAPITKPTTIKEGETIAFSATVTDSGINDLEYRFDGGAFIRQMDIFSLDGIERLTLESPEYDKLAIELVLSNSQLFSPN